MRTQSAFKESGRVRPSGAFTVLELLVVVTVIALLSSLLLPALAMAKMKAQANICATNLKYLGTATTMYINDNTDKIPYAALTLQRGLAITWDDLVDSYLGGSLNLTEKWTSPYEGEKEMSYLRCPSDQMPFRGQAGTSVAPVVHRRTYAMPRFKYEAQRVPWPPSMESRSGVGLAWDFSSEEGPDLATVVTWNAYDSVLTEDGIPNFSPTRQFAIRGNVIDDPASTILLTERLHVNNLMGDWRTASIDTPSQHVQTGIAIQQNGEVLSLPSTGSHHNDKFSYLKVDGHVELLSPIQTIAPGASIYTQSRMWTINPRD